MEHLEKYLVDFVVNSNAILIADISKIVLNISIKCGFKKEKDNESVTPEFPSVMTDVIIPSKTQK